MSEQKKQRRKNYPLRLSLSERAALEVKAKAAGLKLSAYLRQAGLNKTISTKTNRVPEINRATYIELIKIGNNINQLARIANVGIKRGEKLNLEIDKLTELSQHLDQLKLEVLAIKEPSPDDS